MANIKIQCNNCEQRFTSAAFEEHICDYDQDHNYIEDEEEDDDEKKVELPAPPTNPFENHPVLKMLNDNNTFIYKWLKDVHKFDGSATQSLDQPPTAAATTTTGGGKKCSGPHACTRCDRKFVHATGLARHMERHEQDEQKGELDTAMMPAMKVTNSLNIVGKCMKCFRIFSRVDDGLAHLRDAHEMPDFIEEIDITDDDDDDVDGGGGEPTLVPLIGPDARPSTEDGNNNSSIADPFANPLQLIVLTSILQCEFCDYVFPNVDALLMHEGSHDPHRGYECTLCEIHVPTVKAIATHWRTECAFERYDEAKNTGLITYFVCNVCENKFKTLPELYEHRYSMFHLFPRQCAIDCKDSSSRNADERKTDQQLRVGCEICGQLMDTAKAIILHHAEHLVKKSGRKEGGGAGQRAESRLAAIAAGGGGGANGLSGGAGTTNNSKYRQYLCDVCGKSYTQSSHLWQHLRFHKGLSSLHILYTFVLYPYFISLAVKSRPH